MEPDLYAFIQEHIDQHHYPPSVRDCSKFLGLGLSATQRRLEKLRADGLIETTPGIARSIRITGSVAKAPEETM